MPDLHFFPFLPQRQDPAFIVRVQVGGFLYRVWGTQQGGVKALTGFAEVSGVSPLPGTGGSSQVPEGDSDSVSEGHLAARRRHKGDC